MKPSQAPIAALLALACAQLAPPAAHAGPGTWRCGNSYSDQPCDGGKAIELDDARGPVQRREADSATREAQAAADRLERERVRLESSQARRSATLIDNSPQPARAGPSQASAAGQKKKKGRKEADYFSAHDPVATAKKKAEKATAKRASRS